MSKVLVNETSLTGIANAIREKNGEATTYKPSEMAAAIAAIQSGSADNVPNPISFTGDCSYLFSNNKWNWVLQNYNDRLMFDNITDAPHMFEATTLDGYELNIPITVGTSAMDCDYMFKESNIKIPDDYFTQTNLANKLGNCNHMFKQYKGDTVPGFSQSSNTHYECNSMFESAMVKTIGDLALSPSGLSSMFKECKYLRHCPNISFKNYHFRDYQYATNSQIFTNCYSLRTVPEDLLKKIYNTGANSRSSVVFYNLFYSCYALDEVRGLNPQSGVLTSNVFDTTFLHCSRLKNIIFATQDDGSPYTVSWKNQTIDISSGVGWFVHPSDYAIDFNSGITRDKKVDGSNYNELKNDPDWYTGTVEYSRFNHDSAVSMINSLPDASEYLYSQSGATNTVKFRHTAGALTDGGSCGSLTEEEIAVATAKGWTISYQV